VLTSTKRKSVALPFDPATVGDEVVLSQAQVALRGGLFDQALLCARIVADRARDVEWRCEALRIQSNAHRMLCEWSEALDAARREAQIATASGLDDRLAEAHNAEAGVYLSRGQPEAARPVLLEGLKRARAPRLLGVLWQNLGIVETGLHRFAEAERALDTSRGFFDAAGDPWGVACTLINQGCIRLDVGDAEGATQVFAKAITAGRAANDLDLVASAMMNQARAYFRLGRLDEAEFHASSAAGFYVSSKMALRYAECLMVLGDIELARGERDIALRCWRRGLETAEELGAAGIRDELRQRLEQDLDHSQ
jgi:tetratricopeptide (TPR) repeat protein